MSAPDTSQSLSGVFRSQRPNGESELNSWTQGLGGAPRPNPVMPPSGSHHLYSSGMNSSPNPIVPPSSPTVSSPTVPSSTPRSASPNPNGYFDQKPSPFFPNQGGNPFLTTPSTAMSQGIDNRPEVRGSAREFWGASQTADPQNFDLSSYTHAQSRPSAFSVPKDFTAKMTEPTSAQASSQQGFNDWGHQSALSQGNNSHQQGFNLQSSQETHTGSGDFDEFDTEGMTGSGQPHFANKKIFISILLSAALIFGGGIYYVYNSFFETNSEEPTPLIKNAQGPSKVKPTDPGGKQFAHSDSKILGRLDDPSSSSQVDQSADPSAGSRKVSTLVVGRDGTIQPPNPPDQSQTVAPSVSVPVPGMTLIESASSTGKSTTALSNEDGNSAASSVPSGSKEASTSADASQSKETSQVSSGSAPATQNNSASPSTESAKLINPSSSSSASVSGGNAPEGTPRDGKDGNAASSTTESMQKSTLRGADLTDLSPKTVSGSQANEISPISGTKKKSEVKTASVGSSTQPSRSTSSPSSGLGYVPVLASVPVSGSSRITALQRYADLQQKYNAILQNKIPDIQEANLGTKGRYHRLIVGPPGSKEGAEMICSQLKSAGYSECWIMAF